MWVWKSLRNTPTCMLRAAKRFVTTDKVDRGIDIDAIARDIFLYLLTIVEAERVSLGDTQLDRVVNRTLPSVNNQNPFGSKVHSNLYSIQSKST